MNEPEDYAGLLDIPALTHYLAEHVAGDDVPLEIGKHSAGFSNETFFVARGAQQWVLRRPPRGVFLPTAHDVVREYRVMRALQDTQVRVPRMVVACTDSSVIGAPFYLMERVEGDVIREDLPPALDTPAERQRISEEMVDALVELHAVDYRAVGLEGLGRPAGYLERQIRRWIGQLELTLHRTRPLPALEEAGRWLTAHLPESGPPAIVHGDFKPDNVIFAAMPPARLQAILDWEMATIGDPLADLGWLLSYWTEPGEQPEEVPPGINMLDTTRPGFLDRAGLIARYEQRTGRSMRHVPFYLCLAVWKLAIILEGLYAHYLEGTASNPRAAEFEWRVPHEIARIERIIGDRPERE